jgi:hypothetical protein
MLQLRVVCMPTPFLCVTYETLLYGIAVLFRAIPGNGRNGRYCRILWRFTDQPWRCGDAL